MQALVLSKPSSQSSTLQKIKIQKIKKEIHFNKPNEEGDARILVIAAEEGERNSIISNMELVILAPNVSFVKNLDMNLKIVDSNAPDAKFQTALKEIVGFKKMKKQGKLF